MIETPKKVLTSIFLSGIFTFFSCIVYAQSTAVEGQISGLNASDTVRVSLGNDQYLSDLLTGAGPFRFDDVPPGHYFVKLEIAGYTLPDAKEVSVDSLGNVTGAALSALSLLTNNINSLGLPINKKAIISNGSSYKAPRVGLGTTSRKVAVIISKCSLEGGYLTSSPQVFNYKNIGYQSCFYHIIIESFFISCLLALLQEFLPAESRPSLSKIMPMKTSLFRISIKVKYFPLPNM